MSLTQKVSVCLLLALPLFLTAGCSRKESAASETFGTAANVPKVDPTKPPPSMAGLRDRTNAKPPVSR